MEMVCLSHHKGSVGRNKTAIAKYIRNQSAEEEASDPMLLKNTLARLRVNKQQEQIKTSPLGGAGFSVDAVDGLFACALRRGQWPYKGQAGLGE